MERTLRVVLRVLRAVVIFFALFVISLLSVSADGVNSKKYIADYIAESLYLRLDGISVYDFNCGEAEIFEAIDRVMKSNPELYFVENRFYYSVDGNGIVKEIIPAYKYSRAETKNIKTYCDRELEKILFCIDENMSDFQKALCLHEYLCENFEYDESFANCTMYDLLRTGRGTCQAFTLTYMELLDRVNIDNSYAYSSEIMHIWNVINIDGEWYHADITWDNLSDGVSHANFLLSDREIEQNGHVGFVTANGVECKNEKYSQLGLRASPYKYEYFGGGFIYVDNISRNVYFDKCDGSEKLSLYRIDQLWKKSEGRYFANSFSTPVRAGNRLYFNTKNEIMAIDESFAVTKVCSLDFDAFGLTDSAEGVSCYLDKSGEQSCEIKLEKSMDADGDGEITVLDIAVTSRYFCDNSTFIYKYNVDIDGDRILDAEDLRGLEECLLG